MVCSCKRCGKTFKKKTRQKFFCSEECRVSFREEQIFKLIEENKLWEMELSEPNYRSWIKRFLIKTKGRKCSICLNTTWMGKPIPIICDHIDGNHKNRSLYNFRLVCGNCDMQLDTYKSKNKGNGRAYDKDYYHKTRKQLTES